MCSDPLDGSALGSAPQLHLTPIPLVPSATLSSTPPPTRQPHDRLLAAPRSLTDRQPDRRMKAANGTWIAIRVWIVMRLVRGD